ncbi:hypothetical protein HK102_011613, partial [Quaeritorhiza haematococci]
SKKRNGKTRYASATGITDVLQACKQVHAELVLERRKQNRTRSSKREDPGNGGRGRGEMPEVVDWESIITSRARKLDLKSDESSRGSDTDDADIDDGDDSEEDDAFFGVRGYTKEGSLLGREQENRVRGRRNTSGKEPQGEGWEGENDDEDAGEEDATVNAEGYELSDYRLSGGSDDYTQTDGKLVIGLIGHTVPRKI